MLQFTGERNIVSHLKHAKADKLKIASLNPMFQIINLISDHGSNPENS